MSAPVDPIETLTKTVNALSASLEFTRTAMRVLNEEVEEQGKRIQELEDKVTSLETSNAS